MGQTVSNIKESLQQSAEKEKQANDAMNSLQALAKATSDSFYKQIMSSKLDSAQIPINLVVDHDSIMRCGVSEEPGPIADELKEMFSDFANGHVGDGIAKVLSSGLKMLFGQYAANSSESTKYTIACGDLGGVYRLDIHMFSYQYTSEQLTSITKNVLTVTVVMSSVDTAKLDDNTLRIIVQKCYAACTKEEQQNIYDQIKKNKNSTDASPPLHALRRSFQLGAARLNGHLPGLTSGPPTPDSVPFPALVLLTFNIGTASQNADAIKAYVTGALRHTFQDGLQVTTSPQDDDDAADQYLILSVVAVRNVVDSDSRRAHYESSDADMLIYRKLDVCLFGLTSLDQPVIVLQAYRFLNGNWDDTPSESSLTRLTGPRSNSRTSRALPGVSR